MAFVEKSGSKYVVKKGDNGRVLGTYGSKAAAETKVKALHKANHPLARNKGATARKRNNARK